MKFQALPLLLLLNFAVIAQNKQRQIDSLSALIEHTSAPDPKVGYMGQLALIYFTIGEYDKGEDLYQEAARIATPLSKGKALGLLYNSRGTMFYYGSEFDSALYYYDRGLKLRTEAGDKEGVVKSLNNIAGIYYMQNEHKKAIEYYETALKKEEELGVAEGTYVFLNNIGTVYTSLKMYDRAIGIYRKSQKLYQDNPRTLQFVNTGLSIIYKEQNNYDSAIKYSSISVKVSREFGDPLVLAYALINMASCYTHFKKYDQAISALQEASAIKVEDPLFHTAVAANLAGVYMHKENIDSAMKYMDRLVKLEEKHKIEKHQEDLSKIYATYYYHKKDYEKSWNYMQIYDRYRDSTYNLETIRQINEMQEKYETEKKEKQNQLLQVENRTVRATRNYLLVILAVTLLAIVGGVFAFVKIRRTNRELQLQKQIVTEKQKEILDSIHYARRIQFALLASDGLLKNNLPEHFVLFRPKDVVSGDFYWATKAGDQFMLITADCTGHGVPGAFMSLLNISKLTQVVNEKGISRPDLVLNEVRAEIVKSLNSTGSGQESRDGMDATVCLFDFRNRVLQWAGANNPVYIVRDATLIAGKADKMPVGMGHDDSQPFTLHTEQLRAGDLVYTTTDGFADQFGGPRGKKFKFRQMEELLVSINNKPMSEQKELLSQAFDSWRGALEQVDDVCVIGIKIS